jgi:hypothetical protein
MIQDNWFALIMVVVAILFLIILLIKKNHKDKKELFIKKPGDLPDPTFVESEFDKKD